ncbi:MAG: hypothetical protein J2P19_19270 [Pseudonocardia sp.]|nr:hypothetical protein [Pseudonocardia sp.]
MHPTPDEVARRHRLAVEQAMRRRHDELTGRRDALRAEPVRVRADLARLRLGVSSEVADALRRLRDDSRAYLDTADRAARRAFPELFAAAATELTLRVGARLRGLGLSGPDRARPAHRPRVGASRRRRWVSVEDRLTVLLGASGGIGLGRLLLALMPADGTTGVVSVSLAVGLGVGVACWLAGIRRAVAERARLRRWLSEALADLRAGLDSGLSERLLAAERGLITDIAGRTEELDAELREHRHLARRLAAREVPPGPAQRPSAGR